MSSLSRKAMKRPLAASMPTLRVGPAPLGPGLDSTWIRLSPPAARSATARESSWEASSMMSSSQSVTVWASTERMDCATNRSALCIGITTDTRGAAVTGSAPHRGVLGGRDLVEARGRDVLPEQHERAPRVPGGHRVGQHLRVVASDAQHPGPVLTPVG